MRNIVLLAALGTLALAASCVDDSFPEGLPCEGPEQSCPPGQSCLPRGGGWVACYSSEDDVVPFVCNVIEQDCIDSLACYWNPPAMGGTSCELPGAIRAKQLCTSHSDCAAEHGCHPSSPEMGAPKVCLRYCVTSDTMGCAPAEMCEPLEGALGVCVFNTCDPNASMPQCPAPEQCYFDDQTDEPLCRPAGSRGQGQTCAGPADCEAGLHCFDCGNTIRLCSAYCDTSAGDTDCNGVSGAPTCAALGQGTLGACSPCP